MNVESKNPVVPAMVRSWIEDMLDNKQNANMRQNRYMMLEYTHRVIGKALDLHRIKKL